MKNLIVRYLIGVLCVLSSCMVFSKQHTRAQKVQVSQFDLVKHFTAPNNKSGLSYHIYRHKKNGLVVILYNDPSVSLVRLEVGYPFGSAQDSADKTGIAHLFEHMMFEGSKHVAPSQHHALIEQAGGYTNAYTSSDFTVYHQTFPANALERVLWLEADRLAFLAQSLTQEKFDAQRKVVTNEKLQTMTNRPYGLVYEKIAMTYYPPEHPYYKTPIGWSEDLAQVSLKDLQKFAQNRYTPNHAVLAIGGQFDTQQTLQWIDQYFGSIPAGPDLKPLEPSVIHLEQDKWATYEAPNITASLLSIFYPTNKPDTQEFAALTLLSNLLGGMEYSALQTAFNTDERIVFVRTYNQSRMLDSTFSVGVGINPTYAKDLASILHDVDTKIREFAAHPPSQDDINAVLAAHRSDLLMGLETVASRVSLLREDYMETGDPNHLFVQLSALEQVTPVQIQQVCQKYLLQQHRYVMSVVPEGGAQWAAHPSTQSLERQVVVDNTTEAPFRLRRIKLRDQFDRAKVPDIDRQEKRSFPDIWQADLAPNVVVHGFEDRQLPVVNMRMVVPSGAYAETHENAGVADMLTSLLVRGPQGMTETQFQKKMSHLGLSLRITTSFCDWEIDISILREHLDEGLALIAQTLKQPALRQTDLDKLRQDLLLNLEQEQNTPSALLATAQRQLMYLPSDRRSLPFSGSAASIKNASIQKIQRYWRDHFHMGQAEVYVAGDVSQAKAVKALGTILRQWPAPRQRWTCKDTHLRFVQPGIYLVNAQDAKQSFLHAYKPLMPARQWMRRLDVTLTNAPFGEAFSSRLNQQLREDKGYTYGIHSFVKQIGPLASFEISGQVKTEHTRESIDEIQRVMKGYVQSGPTDAEVRSLQMKYANQELMRYQTLWSKINLAQYLFENNYTEETLKKRQQQISDFSVAKAQHLARKWLQSDDLIVIVVGDQKKLLKQFASSAYRVYPLQLSQEQKANG